MKPLKAVHSLWRALCFLLLVTTTSALAADFSVVPDQSVGKVLVHRPHFCAIPKAGGISTKQPVAASRNNRVAFQTYGSYFESNESGLKGTASYLILRTQAAFDKIFGAAAVMGNNSFLPPDTFKSKLVVAVIKRGNRTWSYSVERVDARNGTLSIRYKAVASKPSTATFASPLIVAVGKKTYRSVVFIENGRRVAKVKSG